MDKRSWADRRITDQPTKQKRTRESFEMEGEKTPQNKMAGGVANGIRTINYTMEKNVLE